MVLPPQERSGQRVVREEWTCLPAAESIEEVIDDFGNRVLHLQHARIDESFSFSLTLETQHEEFDIAKEFGLSSNGIGAFLLPSALCDLTGAIETKAKQIGDRHFSPALRAEAFCEFAFQHVEYAPGVTKTETRASQTLESGLGVCQDHAHLMISLCRAARIPARYVSGYLPGEGAMHAWVEVLVDDRWLAFDPTHNRRARVDYVYVACGRDFRDCAPITGQYRGRAQANLESYCRTTLLDL